MNFLAFPTPYRIRAMFFFDQWYFSQLYLLNDSRLSFDYVDLSITVGAGGKYIGVTIMNLLFGK